MLNFLIFLKRCQQSIAFDQFARTLLDKLYNSPSDKLSSINQITRINPILTKESYPLLEDSFNEIDKKYPLSSEILLFYLKTTLERMHQNKCKNFRDFEKDRFSSRTNISIAALEGHCRHCGLFDTRIIKILNYFKTYALPEESEKYNHMNQICHLCYRGLLDFEWVSDSQLIKDIPKEKVERGEKYFVTTIDDHISILRTIFERNPVDSKSFTKISMRYQAILRLFYDHPDEFFKIRDVIKKLKGLEPGIFKNIDINARKMISEETYYYQFETYMNLLLFCNVLVSRKVREYKTSRLISEYKITPEGKTLALCAKYQKHSLNSELYTEFFQNWKSVLKTEPVSSLDKFGIKFIDECINSNLLSYIFDNYFNNLLQHPIRFNNVDLFTQVICTITKSREINKYLWNIWEKSYNSLGSGEKDIFSFHIKLFLGDLIKEKVRSGDRYEAEVYEIRENQHILIAEYRCHNCDNKYCIYKPIPILLYLKFVLGVITDIPYYDFDGVIKCSYCKGKLDVIMI